MPMHIVIGILNSVKKIFAEEERLQKEAEEKQSSGMSTPSIPQLPSSYQNVFDKVNSMK
jgi:hypothetical protein